MVTYDDTQVCNESKCGDIVSHCIVLYCIVLYCIVLYCIVYKFLKWPQGPLGIDIISSRLNQSINQSINQSERIKVTKVTNVTARLLSRKR